MRLKRPISRRSEIGDKVEIDPDRDRVRVGNVWLVCGSVELDFFVTDEGTCSHPPTGSAANRPFIQ